MNEPVTNIDPRFSDPGAVATGWDETRRALEEAELFWISTVRSDGRPHVTPLVAVWLDGALYFSTGATEQKAKNLHGNPHVILMTGCNTWDTGLDVVVDDYLAFGQMMLALGKHGNERILSRLSIEAMTTDQLTPEQKAVSSLVPGFFDTHGWGFGVSVITRRDGIAAVPVGTAGMAQWDLLVL